MWPHEVVVLVMDLRQDRLLIVTTRKSVEIGEEANRSAQEETDPKAAMLARIHGCGFREAVDGSAVEVLTQLIPLGPS